MLTSGLQRQKRSRSHCPMASSFLADLLTIYSISGRRPHLLFTSIPSLHAMLSRDTSLMIHTSQMTQWITMTRRLKHLKQNTRLLLSAMLHCLVAHRSSGIYVSAMHPAQRFVNIHISDQIMTLHIALYAFEPNKLASHSTLQKAKSHANSSVSSKIYVAHILHHKASLSMFSHFLMNLHTGVGLSQFQTNRQLLYLENIDISSSRSRLSQI